MTSIGTSWMEALWGILEIMGAFATPFFRSRRRRWGATDDELETPYAGDHIIPDPKWMANHVISIDATPQQVWPWIAQIGQGRGGFYSYEKLENLAGCKIENTARILEEHQLLRVGDLIKLHVEAPPLTVTLVDEPSTLVLYGKPAKADDSATLSTTWAFLLLQRPDGTTRLISRTRYHYGNDSRSKIMGGALLMEPLSFVMERKMLRVVKALVESSVQQ